MKTVKQQLFIEKEGDVFHLCGDYEKVVQEEKIRKSLERYYLYMKSNLFNYLESSLKLLSSFMEQS